MDEKDFLERMKVILDKEDISIDTSLSDLEEWDSISVISYVALANTSFNKEISPEQIQTCKTIRDLYSILQ